MPASNVEPFKGRLSSLVQAMRDVRDRNRPVGEEGELDRVVDLERRVLRLELELRAMKAWEL